MKLRTCVSPEGEFVYGIYEPSYIVRNFRKGDYISSLGGFADGNHLDNQVNFPERDVMAEAAGGVYEIPNPFPFRGTTYINKFWAENNAADISRIGLPEPPEVSFTNIVEEWAGEAGIDSGAAENLLRILPEPLQLALAETGTDPEDLSRMAEMACDFVHDPESGRPVGLRYKKDRNGNSRPVIARQTLFEVLANNPHIPDDYKTVMTLRPGVQGGSPIMGEWCSADGRSHIFEYLRTNSYIPWGHYAANMADDAIRYRIADLCFEDMEGMRHLYYQRTYVRVAEALGLPVRISRRPLAVKELGDLRREIIDRLSNERERSALNFNRTLWGWNFGFDYAPSRYRLHASHQQIHQQFAMIPKSISFPGTSEEELPAYGGGDLVEEFITEFRKQTGVAFFDSYIQAIDNNKRLSGACTGEDSLVVYDDGRVIVFVPKAQTSQWELQLMTRSNVGNILEADQRTRQSIDYAMFIGIRALGALGAKMITTIEYPKRIDASDTDQRLIYSFLPRLPESPGTFSEAQLRWINGHYPEDFAAACRIALDSCQDIDI